MSTIRLLDMSFGKCCNALCKMRRRDKRKFIVLAILSVFVLYYAFQTLTMPVRFLFINENINKQCIIPDLDPWDKSIMKYVWHPDPIRCDPAPDLAYVDERGFVTFNQSAYQYYGDKTFTCKYMPLIRPHHDDESVKFGEEVSLTLPEQLPVDFFRLRCFNSGGKLVYETLKESVYVPQSVMAEKDNEDDELSKYSVFMFGIDSTSRLSAIRKLPKTYKYLTEELNAYIFKGYMKIGDNTFPNMVSFLSGKRPGVDVIPSAGGKYDIEKFPLIWENFSREHYATFYTEDYPIITSFNTEALGFKDPPTHHYMRPWMLGLRKIGFASEVLKSVLLPFEYKNLNLKSTSSLCYGNKPIFKHVINYYKRFASMYKTKLKFGFSWLVQICHEFVNYLELGDTDFYKFFKFLKDNGHLDNAFLIFLSDHGSRIDDIRNTFIGRIEERMPLLSIVPPESFKKRHQEANRNLLENTNRLTSNLDLFETLNDILKRGFDSSSLKFEDRSKMGISLFRPISETRSCAEAFIPEHFCACYGSTEIPASDPLVKQAANFAVTHLNKLLNKYTDICAELYLFKIHEANLVSLGLSAKGEEENRWTIYKFFSKPEAEKHKRFLVVFETLPGNAMFEATVDYHVDAGMAVNDDVSRTNKYGNTSICVPEKPLRRYCYCKSLLKLA